VVEDSPVCHPGISGNHFRGTDIRHPALGICYPRDAHLAGRCSSAHYPCYLRFHRIERFTGAGAALLSRRTSGWSADDRGDQPGTERYFQPE